MKRATCDEQIEFERQNAKDFFLRSVSHLRDVIRTERVKQKEEDCIYIEGYFAQVPRRFIPTIGIQQDFIKILSENPGCGPTFGSLLLESDRILVSEFDGTYRIRCRIL